MSFPPGANPPPPPPVPPPPTPWGTPPSDPSPGGGSPGGPDGGPRPALVAGLAIALAVALAINAILALRVKDESDQQARLRQRVAALQAEVDTLRRRGAQPGGTVLEQLASVVAELRELEFTGPVDAEILSADALRRRVEKQFAADNPRGELAELDNVLAAFGLIDPGLDLYEILLDVQTEQIAGYYDTKEKTLVVGGDANDPTPLDRVLLAHEYTHALTDQHFDLTHFDELTDARKDDEALAYLTLVEGDATVLMGRYAQEYLTPSEQAEFFAESTQVPSDSLDSAPDVVRRSLLFPYEEGVAFVRALIQRDGIEAVNRAYRDPPTSTEQILHISKYAGMRDDPVEVDVPDLARTLGRGWRSYRDGGFGEFDMRLLVDEYLTRGEAEQAADGWDGGRYAAAESEDGVVVAALSAWDSELEAREATGLLGRWLPNRFGNRGNDMRLSGVSGRGWESPDGAGVVLRDGNRVVLIIGPDRRTVERSRSAFPGF